MKNYFETGLTLPPSNVRICEGVPPTQGRRPLRRTLTIEYQIIKYIDIGVIPKFAGCVTGVNWFKSRGQWADGSFEPAPGMIIFFDWDSPNGESGPQDGLSDHVGIVEKVENGRVYTIEGNTSDSCARRSYSVGYYEILGYGIPAY